MDDWDAENFEKLEEVEKERTLGIGLRQPIKSGLAHVKLPQRHLKLRSSKHKLIFWYPTRTLDLGRVQQSNTTETYYSDWRITLPSTLPPTSL